MKYSKSNYENKYRLLKLSPVATTLVLRAHIVLFWRKKLIYLIMRLNYQI